MKKLFALIAVFTVLFTACTKNEIGDTISGDNQPSMQQGNTDNHIVDCQQAAQLFIERKCLEADIEDCIVYDIEQTADGYRVIYAITNEFYSRRLDGYDNTLWVQNMKLQGDSAVLDDETELTHAIAYAKNDEGYSVLIYTDYQSDIPNMSKVIRSKNYQHLNELSTQLHAVAFAQYGQLADNIYDGVTVETNEDMSKVLYNSTKAIFTLDIDFNNPDTPVVASRNFTRDDLSQQLATSKDKAYSLWYGNGGYGGGDSWSSPVALLENSTGKTTYLADLPNQRQSEAGFFSDGDIYTTKNDSFVIYDKYGTEKLRLEDNFHLGKVMENDVACRYLLATRRDPDTKEFIVVYTETSVVNNEPTYYYNYGDGMELKGLTYKIGLLDKDGSLKRSIETNLTVMQQLYTLARVDMYLSGNDVCYKAYTNRDEVIFEAKTNIETGVTAVK